MPNKIKEFLAGREEILYTKTSLSDVHNLLKTLDETTRIDVKYEDVSYKKRFNNVKPEDVSNFLVKVFESKPNRYHNGYHQIFSGKNDEKHYIYLEEGDIKIRVGEQELRENPTKKVDLEFILKIEK